MQLGFVYCALEEGKDRVRVFSVMGCVGFDFFLLSMGKQLQLNIRNLQLFSITYTITLGLTKCLIILKGNR